MHIIHISTKKDRHDKCNRFIAFIHSSPLFIYMYSRSLSCTCLCGRFSASRTRILSTYAPRTPQKFGHNWQKIFSQNQVQKDSESTFIYDNVTARWYILLPWFFTTYNAWSEPGFPDLPCLHFPVFYRFQEHPLIHLTWFLFQMLPHLQCPYPW